MNKLSEITQYLRGLLKRQKEPKTMRWILEKAYQKFLNKDYPGYVRDGKKRKTEFHQKVWNAINNGRTYPKDKPRFSCVKIDGINHFKAN